MPFSRRSALAAAALALPLALPPGPAAAQESHEPTSDTTEHRLQPRAYLAEAASMAAFARAASALAAERAMNAGVKEHAATVGRDSEQQLERLRAAVPKGEAGVPDDPAPTERQAQLLDELRLTPAGSFDRLYVTMEVNAHERSLRTHRAFARAIDSSPLSRAAEEAAVAAQRHLDRARALAASVKSGPS